MRQDIDQRIKRYLLIKVGLSAVTGILVGGCLAVLGVELALVFGVLAFVLNFIPSVGSIIATLLPLPLVLVNPEHGTLTIALAMALPGLVQLVVGNIIEPKMMGDSLELHPITILLALIFWGMLWGIPGMLLAAPMTAVLRILLSALEITRPCSTSPGRPNSRIIGGLTRPWNSCSSSNSTVECAQVMKSRGREAFQAVRRQTPSPVSLG